MSAKLYSLPPIIDENSEILILGSMPGGESLRKCEYYAHPRNHFWPILYAIFEKTKSADYSERIEFVRGHHIALWDVIGSCERNGSSDSSIKRIECNDIDGLLQRFGAIKLIILNGSKAEAVFRRMIDPEKHSHIRVIRAPSTSPVPGKNVKTFEDKLDIWKQIVKSVVE